MTLPSRISLCMIVKNEEDWIGQCLQSVHSIISEAVVVDTGSSDRTIEIARSFGARVFSYGWHNDFAAARNFSLSRATGDWILVLDADEMIAPSDLPGLLSLTQDRRVCTEFLQRHYTNDYRLSDFTPCRGEFPEIEKGHAGYFESNCTRLFPNGDGLEFRGVVHELVEHSIHEKKRHTINRTRIRIHHFGHTDAVKSKKSKGDIYSPLGEQKIKEEPANWKAYFELGVEHNVNGRRRECVEALTKSAAMNPSYIHTWINLGYAHMELGEFKEALAAYQEALKIDPQCAEAFCNMGVVGMRTQNFKLAEEGSLHALVLNPKYVNAALNLARTYAMIGRYSESILVLRYITGLVPKSVAVLSDMGAVYVQGGLPDIGEKLLREALSMDENQSRVWFNLGIVQRNRGSFSEAKESIRRAVSLDATLAMPEELQQFMQDESPGR